MNGSRDDGPLRTRTSKDGKLALSWTQGLGSGIANATAADRVVMQGMSPRRAAEFSTGRLCARTALAALGGGDHGELRRLPNGAVDWPAGWTGSITHSRDVAVACVGSTTLFRGVGVDVEPDAPMPRESSFAVARDKFIGPAARLLASGSRVGFSARESTFKALSAIGHNVPILTMVVTVWMQTPERGRFAVEIEDATRGMVEGRWLLLTDSMLMTTVIIPA